MVSLDGRVAIITGAGRGIGREHALLFGRLGAKVVVNDTGGANDGTVVDGTRVDGIGVGPARVDNTVADELVADEIVANEIVAGESDESPADVVADEIVASGGEAIASREDVSDWSAAEKLVQTALDRFGDVDIVVNNAGILRDRLLVNMSESEWDDVIRVHLKGHVAPSHFAAAHWRAESKAGRGRPRHIVNTSSTSGLLANPGQTNYGTAKSGIATLTQIAAKELARYDVKVNAVAPAARTRLTMATPGLDQIMGAREGAFDEWDPANIAPLVAYLSSTECRFSGEVFFAQGGVVRRVRSWELADEVRSEQAWDVDELAAALQDW